MKYIFSLFILLVSRLSAEWIPSHPHCGLNDSSSYVNLDIKYYLNYKSILNEGELKQDHLGIKSKILFGYINNNVIAIRYDIAKHNHVYAFSPYRVIVYQDNLNTEIYHPDHYEIYVCLFRNSKLLFKSCISEKYFDLNKTCHGNYYLTSDNKISSKLLMNVDSFSIEYIKK